MANHDHGVESNLKTAFGSELSLSSFLRIEEDSLQKRLGTTDGVVKSHNTVDTVSCSERTFSSVDDTKTVLLPKKSILKNTTSADGMIEDNCDKDRLRAWIDQPIPSPNPSRRRRRRRVANQQQSSSADKKNMYERAKTRFPGRKESRSRQVSRERRPRDENTVEEQWVRTCRFLW